jgi:hypothetical protein
MTTQTVAAQVSEGLPKRWAVVAAVAFIAVAAVLAVKKPLLLLALPLAIPALGAVFVWPNFYTLLAIGLVYLNVPVVAVRFHGAPMVVGMMIPMLLVIPIVHRWLFQRQAVKVDVVFQLATLFVLVKLFATLFSDNREASLRDIGEMMSEGLLFYLLVFNAVQSPAVLRQVVWVLLLCGAAMGALCFLQHATKTYHKNYGGFARIEDQRGFFTEDTDLEGQIRQQRLSGPIGTQNRFAQIMLMLAPLGMFRIWGETNARLRIVAAGATALVILGLMLAFSRGATVAFGIMFVGMIVLRYISARQCLAVLVGLCLLLVAMPQYLTRMASLGALVSAKSNLGAADGSARSRTAEALSALYMFAEHPWTGVGPGMFRYHFQDYAEIVGTDVSEVKVQEELRQAHSLYLEVISELGIPGIAVFLLFVTVLLVRLERARRASLIAGRADLAFLVAGFLFAMVAYLGTGLFLHFACVRYFWLMTALASAATAIVTNELSTANSNRNSAHLTS